MSQYDWQTCPSATRAQIEQLCSNLADLITNNLIGIYLHGSLAMGCFNPDRSDLDLLVLTTMPLPISQKRQVIMDLLAVSGQPSPIEISFVTHTQLHPWCHPTPYDLHYSEAWRDTYSQHEAPPAAHAWEQAGRRDPDLAAHVTVTRTRGICIVGAAISSAFPVVPAEDYLASILDDVRAGIASIAANPVYAILNCCRTWAYLRAGLVLSKDEGGQWGLPNLPAPIQQTVQLALHSYRGDIPTPVFDVAALQAFAAFAQTEILTGH